MPDPRPPVVLAVSQDLVFASKIVAAARALDAPPRMATSLAQALRQVHAGLRVAVVDLQAAPDADAAGLRALREALPADAALLAFGPHVDVARLAEARDAGCDPVWPRSRMAQEFDSWLQTRLGDAPTAAGSD